MPPQIADIAGPVLALLAAVRLVARMRMNVFHVRRQIDRLVLAGGTAVSFSFQMAAHVPSQVAFDGRFEIAERALE